MVTVVFSASYLIGSIDPLDIAREIKIILNVEYVPIDKINIMLS